MKRLALVVLCLIVFASMSASGQGLKFGAGAFGGLDIPLLQDDNSSGPIFGIRGVLNLTGPIGLEPYLYFGSYEAAEFDEFTNDLDGAEITVFGLDATLFKARGQGVGFYLHGGAGFYDISDDAIDQAYGGQGSRLGVSGGLGLTFGVTPYLQIDIRGKANFVTQEDGGTRKSAAVTGGLNYFFGVQ